MKAKKINREPDFKPVTIEVTFETEEELVFFKTMIGAISISEAKELTRMKYPDGNLLLVLYSAIPNPN